jgi:hypothetical protein
MDKMDNRHRLWVFVGLVTAAFAITLAMVVGHRLNDEALGVLIGIVGGVGATVLASASRLLVAAFARRGCPPQTLRAAGGLALKVWFDDDVSQPLLKLCDSKTNIDVVVIWPEEVEPLIATLAEAMEMLAETPVSLSQIPSLTDAETVLAEGEYRCGYRDGWIQAVGAMCDLMNNRQLTWQAAHAVCWRHWETTLLPWMWPNQTRNTATIK